MSADDKTVEMSRRQALGTLAATVLGTAAVIKGADLLGSIAESVGAARELLGRAEVFYLATVDEEAVLRKAPEIPTARTEPNEITRYKEDGHHRFLVVPVPVTKPPSSEHGLVCRTGNWRSSQGWFCL